MQDVTAIDDRVIELQNRVCGLLLVIVDSITNNHESAESILKASEGIETEMRTLHAYVTFRRLLPCSIDTRVAPQRTLYHRLGT